jgi:hypothetical protein
MSRKMSGASTPEAREADAADDPDTTLLLTVIPPMILFIDAAARIVSLAAMSHADCGPGAESDQEARCRTLCVIHVDPKNKN